MAAPGELLVCKACGRPGIRLLGGARLTCEACGVDQPAEAYLSTDRQLRELARQVQLGQRQARQKRLGILVAVAIALLAGAILAGVLFSRPHG